MIRNIIFDIGNVLADYDYDTYLKSFGFEPEKEQKIREAMFEGPYWAELDREEMPLQEILESFVSLAPEYRDDIMRVFEGAAATIVRREDAIPWITELKERGFGVYYLSNFSALMVEKVIDCLDFLPLMDGGMFSYEVKKVKPEPEIYDAFLEKFPDIKPEESVFIDDSDRNLIAAIAKGFNVIRCRDRKQVERELKHILEADKDAGSEEDKMDNVARKQQGLPYCYDDPALLGDQHIYQNKMYEYNQTPATETEKRQEMLKEVFAEVGENCIVEPPLNANWGCKHVHLGKGIYINSNVTFVDDEHVYIGDNCLIAPNVVFSTSGHPILPVLREHHYVYNLPIHVGSNVWIGSGAQIMPGITIGDNSVIGSGSVVCEDIPANVVAYGVPCRVVREIGEKDVKYYYKDRKLDVWE